MAHQGQWECSKAGCQLWRTGLGRVRIFLAAKNFFPEYAKKGLLFHNFTILKANLS